MSDHFVNNQYLYKARNLAGQAVPGQTAVSFERNQEFKAWAARRIGATIRCFVEVHYRIKVKGKKNNAGIWSADTSVDVLSETKKDAAFVRPAVATCLNNNEWFEVKPPNAGGWTRI